MGGRRNRLTSLISQMLQPDCLHIPGPHFVIQVGLELMVILLPQPPKSTGIIAIHYNAWIVHLNLEPKFLYLALGRCLQSEPLPTSYLPFYQSRYLGTWDLVSARDNSRARCSASSSLCEGGEEHTALDFTLLWVCSFKFWGFFLSQDLTLRA